MLGYYTDSVFQNDQASFNILLNYLFSCLMLKDEVKIPLIIRY